MRPPIPEIFPERCIQIDEDGFPVIGGLVVTDAAIGKQILEGLVCEDRFRLMCFLDGAWVGVEAFDSPLVALSTKRKSNNFYLCNCDRARQCERSGQGLPLLQCQRYFVENRNDKERNYQSIHSGNAQAAYRQTLDFRN